jgi:hypothetical protein
MFYSFRAEAPYDCAHENSYWRETIYVHGMQEMFCAVINSENPHEDPHWGKTLHMQRMLCGFYTEVTSKEAHETSHSNRNRKPQVPEDPNRQFRYYSSREELKLKSVLITKRTALMFYLFRLNVIQY